MMLMVVLHIAYRVNADKRADNSDKQDHNKRKLVRVKIICFYRGKSRKLKPRHKACSHHRQKRREKLFTPDTHNDDNNHKKYLNAEHNFVYDMRFVSRPEVSRFKAVHHCMVPYNEGHGSAHNQNCARVNHNFTHGVIFCEYQHCRCKKRKQYQKN